MFTSHVFDHFPFTVHPHFNQACDRIYIKKRIGKKWELPGDGYLLFCIGNINEKNIDGQFDLGNQKERGE